MADGRLGCWNDEKCDDSWRSATGMAYAGDAFDDCDPAGAAGAAGRPGRLPVWCEIFSDAFSIQALTLQREGTKLLVNHH